MLLRAAARIETMNSASDVWSAAVECLSAAGIDHVIYVTAQDDLGAPRLLTTTPEIHAGTAISDDPFLLYCCKTYETTRTGAAFLSVHRPYITPAAARFIESAARWGFRSGLGIPTRLHGARRHGGFNLGTPFDRTEFEDRILPRREEFRLFCMLMHRRFEELGLAAPVAEAGEDGRGLIAPGCAALSALSPREREVIWLQAQGLLRKDVARICGISPHTVAEYTAKAYRKLGVHNRAEAARIMMAGRPPTDPGPA